MIPRALLAGPPLLAAACGAIPRPEFPPPPGRDAPNEERLARARALAEAGYDGAALATLEETLAREPGRADALALRADLRDRRGEERAALADYEALLSAGIADPEILYRVGHARARIGEWDAAIAAFDRYVEARPEEADGRRGLGHALFEKGRSAGDAAAVARAEDEFERARELLPTSADVRFGLGSVREARGDFEGAEGEYRATLALDPEHLGALENLALLLAEGGRLEEARALAGRALVHEKDPRWKRRLETIAASALGP